MAKKGSKKELSVRHEQYVADCYQGRWSKSSGGAVTDEGDVRTSRVLYECKGKFGVLTSEKPVRSTLLRQMEKVADEAWSVGKEPAVALRFYDPGNILADPEGWVDLVVRLLEDDVYEKDILATYRSGCGEQGRAH